MRIAICDDCKEMMIFLKSTLYNLFKQYLDDFDIFDFYSGSELLDSYKENKFDIIFLDIDMPKVTGFDVAKAIREDFSKCYIIFISSHSELVYDSFDFQPFDFVRKTLNETLNEKLSQVVKKIVFHSKQNEIIIFEDEYTRKYPIPIRNIVYLESEKHYINYYIIGEKHPFRLRGTIKGCEIELKKYDFIRIHKGYIVNLGYVDFIDRSKDEIQLKGITKSLPLSRNLKKEIEEKYKLYLRNLI